MENFIFSIIAFILIYLFYLLFVILKNNKLEKFRTNTYVTYLVNVYGLDLKKVNIKVLAHIIALTNALILSSIVFIINYIDNFILKMLLGFIILIPFQFGMYHIIGKMYEKNKQTKKTIRKKR